MTRAAEILRAVENHPLHRFVGVETIHAEGGRSSLEITVNANSVNPGGAFHGGVAYMICDMACFAALMSELPDGELIVTHDIHVSVLRAAKLGDRVRAEGRVLKRGRNIGFMEAELSVDGRLIAKATVTKSILKPAA